MVRHGDHFGLGPSGVIAASLEIRIAHSEIRLDHMRSQRDVMAKVLLSHERKHVTEGTPLCDELAAGRAELAAAQSLIDEGEAVVRRVKGMKGEWS